MIFVSLFGGNNMPRALAGKAGGLLLLFGQPYIIESNTRRVDKSRCDSLQPDVAYSPKYRSPPIKR